MKIINLNDKKNSLIEIKKRIKIRKNKNLFCDDQCAKIEYYINPISAPAKLSMFPVFSFDFTKYMIKKYIINILYGDLFNQTKLKTIKYRTEADTIYKIIKIKDFNLIGFEVIYE